MAGLLTVLLAQVSSSGPLLPLPLPLPTLQLFTTVAWNPSPSPEVVGYAVYYGVANLPVTNRVDAGDTLSVTIPLLVGTVCSIYVVAYTADGVESEPSNVLNYTPPPLTPLRLSKLPGGSMQLRFRTSPLALCRVEWTDNLAAPVWRVLVVVPAGSNGDVVLTDSSAGSAPARFYRAAKL